MSLGQRAYEAFALAIMGSRGHWDVLSPLERRAWQVSASAVVTAEVGMIASLHYLDEARAAVEAEYPETYRDQDAIVLAISLAVTEIKRGPQ